MEPSNDPSIHNEPHLRDPEIPKPMNESVDRPLDFDQFVPSFSSESPDDVQHSVWDEPVLVNGLVRKPTEQDLTYSNWLRQRQLNWSQGKAWLATAMIAALSGPWALLLVLFNGLEFNRTNVIMVCFFAPLAQEVCKNAIALWVVERRPYFFTGWFQIFACSMASATIFVAIMKMISGYLFPPENMTWFLVMTSLFLFMHLVSSTLAATGLELIWRRAVFLRQPPRLEFGYRWFMGAFLVNLVYSTMIFLYELFIRLFAA